MTHATGLRSVWLASAAAVLPLATLSAATVAATATIAPAQFSPPSGPMLLTRVLNRPLPGGAHVSTARTYEIQFVPDGSGFRIDGKLVSVDVDAPAQFAALAELERNRADTGMFPMWLDRSGRFIALNAPPVDQDKVAARKLALASIPASVSGPERKDASDFIGQLTQQSVQTAWPRDLFNPIPGKQSSSQIIPLPGGKTGHVLVEIEASVSEPGLVTSLRRLVTTHLGGSSRTTDENWILAHKP